MENLLRIYYNENGDLVLDEDKITESTPFIEIPAETAPDIMAVVYGRKWRVLDGQLTEVEDTEVTNTTEYKIISIRDELSRQEWTLSMTDYVITKLNELRLEDESEYEAEKAGYADVLSNRKTARKRINELREELKALEG